MVILSLVKDFFEKNYPEMSFVAKVIFVQKNRFDDCVVS